MFQLSFALLTYLRTSVRSHHDLGLEILALRQQLAVLKRRQPRPHLERRDRLFWVALHALWDRWMDALIIVKPETVVGWHRAGFRLYWRFRSSVSRAGRCKIDAEVYEAIKRMARENPPWGAPKIHGEILKLGFKVAERTVSRYLARATPRPSDSGQLWQTFLRNHREVTTAMDFFSVPTITFKLLYCFFVIDHNRRRILHFNVTLIQLLDGFASNCAMLSQTTARTNTRSWIAIRNSAPRCWRCSSLPPFTQCGRASGVRGKTESRNDGLAVHAESASIT